MATEQAVRPERDFKWWLSESTRPSLFIGALGAVALLLVTVGTTIVLLLNGITPVEDLIRGFKSNEFRGLCILAMAGGGLASILGWSSFRRMPTKVSKEECVAGAVLGIQAVVLGALAYWFSKGAVDTFAVNYLDFSVIENQWDAFFRGIKNTIFLAFTSEFFGVLLGLVFSVLASSSRAVVRAPARAYINFFRGTPLIWQLIFIGVGLPIGLRISIDAYTAGVIAFSLNTGAYAAEVFRAGIRSIEKSQLEAARGLGMSYMQAMRYAVIPQAIRVVIPPLMNEFVILLKDTSLVIALGLTAMQRDLMTWGQFGVANSANATFLVFTGLGYLAISLPLIRIVNILEKRFRSGLVGVGA